jgi:hypothetical protein
MEGGRREEDTLVQEYTSDGCSVSYAYKPSDIHQANKTLEVRKQGSRSRREKGSYRG